MKFLNIANQDYDGKINDICATDVSYILSPKDVKEKLCLFIGINSS